MKFDETNIIRRLESMAPGCRLVFAAACAERLNAGYQAYAGRAANRWADANAKVLNRAMAVMWNRAAGGQTIASKLRSLIDECIALIPTQEEFVPARHKHVESAASAVAHALSASVSETAKDAALPARVAYAAADAEAIRVSGLDMADRENERRILSSRMVQEELRRQDRDLRELAAATLRGDEREALDVIKRRASRDEAMTLS